MLACSHYRNASKQTTRLDLCAFGFSTQRLEQTATCSISTISKFICQSLQFCWSQTSHTKSSDEILKRFYRKGFSEQTGLHEMAMAAFESQYIADELITT
nr:hypothetical protein [Tanacetum cinerariifolium]